MRATILVSGLLGLAAALPRDSSTSTEVSPSLKVEKRDSPPKWCQYLSFWLCQKNPAAYGPTVNTPSDTVAAFQAYKGFSQAATSAVTPSGYTASFQNLQGATSTSVQLGSFDNLLTSYDPAPCAAKCTANKACAGFNIWFERDPSTTTNTPCCPNPPSLTRIKCSIWGTQTSATTANNKGVPRDSFQVAIAGSNGYNKLSVSSSTSSSVSSSTVKSSSTSTGATSRPNSATSATSTLSLAQSNSASVASSSGPTSSATVLSATTSSVPSSSDLVSNSAITASASAAAPNTDPGSPVTATIASAAAATTCASPVQTPDITFNLNHTTTGYETVWMYGSIDQLGAWNPDNAVGLSAYQGSSIINWFTDLNITAGTYMEYKYFTREPDWSITWPPLANRQYTVPTGCQSEIVVNDVW